MNSTEIEDNKIGSIASKLSIRDKELINKAFREPEHLKEYFGKRMTMSSSMTISKTKSDASLFKRYLSNDSINP
jgi:hypothetical protein